MKGRIYIILVSLMTFNIVNCQMRQTFPLNPEETIKMFFAKFLPQDGSEKLCPCDKGAVFLHGVSSEIVFIDDLLKNSTVDTVAVDFNPSTNETYVPLGPNSRPQFSSNFFF